MVTKSSYAHGEFCWVDLASHGMAAVRSFYAEVFGWKVVDQDTRGGPPYAWFELDDGPVAGLGELSDAMKAQGTPPAWNSYVDVDDVEAVTARAAELGATVVAPVMQILDAGRLSFVRDPGGASLAFWEPGAHAGAVRINEPGCCCWHELASEDVEASRTFYGALLGWEFAEYPGLPSRYYVAKNRGEDVGGLVQLIEENREQGSGWRVYFAVDDADAAVARVMAGGGTVRVAPFASPVGAIAVFRDPQGASFSVLHKSASC